MVSRTKIYQDDNKWLWKFVIRLLAILLAAVGIGLLAWLIGRHGAYTYVDFSLVPWGLIPLGLSVIWNMANVITLLARNRPIHPGANVGCDLVLWIMLIITTTFLIFAAVDAASYWDYSFYDDGSNYSSETDYSHQSNVKAAISAMSLAVMLCHFALFISACRYTHERRRSRITRQATAIASSIISEMTRNGQLPPARQPLLASEGLTTVSTLEHAHARNEVIHPPLREDPENLVTVPRGTAV